MSLEEIRNAAECGKPFCTHIGGAATIEGVMMRGKKSWVVAVHRDNGSIYVEEHDLPDQKLLPTWTRWPILRGCVSFCESVALSYRAMQIASSHIYEDVPAARPAERDAPAPPLNTTTAVDSPHGAVPAAFAEQQPLTALELLASVGAGAALGLALFVAFPVLAVSLLLGEVTSTNSVIWNLAEATVRICVLVAYVGITGLIPDMRRIYGYHGAEHQSIHCLEHGQPLTPENAAKFSRLHMRCGTAFLVMTIAVAIVIHSVAPVASWADMLGLSGALRVLFVFFTRLAMLPLVAGLSYEVTVKWAGSRPNNPLVKLILWPGMQMQRLTTRVADKEMLECAIEALKRVDARERTGQTIG